MTISIDSSQGSRGASRVNPVLKRSDQIDVFSNWLRASRGLNESAIASFFELVDRWSILYLQVCPCHGSLVDTFLCCASEELVPTLPNCRDPRFAITRAARL